MKTLKRNPSIELIRILACLIVIACHINFYLISDTDTERLKTFYFCLFSDGVGIFWMITGCFLFSSKSLSALWKRTVSRILLPVIGLFFVCFFLSSRQLPVKYFDHTWYIFVYLTVLAVYPLLKLLADFLDAGVCRDLVFLGVSLVLVIANDLCCNRLLFFGFTPLSGLLPASLEILWGHVLYRRLSGTFPRPLNKYVLFSGTAALFLLLNFLRTQAQLFLSHAGNNYNLRVWHTSFGMIAAACVLAAGLLSPAALSQASSPTKNQKILRQMLPVTIASYTFGIYLVHPLIAALLQRADLWNRLQDALFFAFGYSIGSALFLFLGTALLFLASIALCVCLRRLRNALKNFILRRR